MVCKRTWLVATFVFGCGGPGRAPLADELDAGASVMEPPEVVEVDAGAPRDAGARPSLLVNVTSTKLALCAGECAQLTASARHANGPVSYAWSDGLPASASQRVCPSATHTYRVEASSQSSGEFITTQRAEHGITLSVRDCSVPKPDDGVMCELRSRILYPRSGDIFSTRKPWLDVNTTTGASAIQATPDGGAWLVGSFSRELDLGAGLAQAQAPISTFLHKIDADCKPVRTLVLRATAPGDTILPTAFTVDAQGNAYVASIAGPLFEYNPFAGTPVRWTSELLIEKIAPSGESLYRYRIATGVGSAVTEVVANMNGELFASGIVSETTDLGAGLPFGIASSTYRSFALKIGADARFAAQRVDTHAYQVALAGELIFNVTTGHTAFDVVLGAAGSGPERWGLTSMRQTDLSVAWQAPFDTDEGQAQAVAEGLSTGELAVLFTKDRETGRGSTMVRRYAADGALRRETKLPDYEASYVYQLCESEPGTLVTALSTPVGTELVKLGADDAVRWGRLQDWGGATQVSGLSALRGGEVYVMGQARVPGAPEDAPELEYDLVVRKLRAQ